ncbi:MAG: hypothetical protein J6B68_10930 [Lachnospiraceae bacterium]|nr:hypothetical protein [Lachnospiraceae bacterium]
MAAKEYKAGTLLIQEEQALTALHVIAKGSIRATFPGGEYYLSKGDVIGVCEVFSDSHFISYSVVEDAVIASYPCNGNSLTTLLRANKDLTNFIVSSFFRQIHEILDQYEVTKFDCDNFYHYLTDSYSEYIDFCNKHGLSPRALPGLENLTELVLEEDIHSWLNGYYDQFQKLLAGNAASSKSTDFLLGLLLRGSEDVHNIISVCRALYDYKAEIASLLMNENHLDFFDLYASIIYRIGPNADDSSTIIAAISTMMIQLEGQSFIDQTMYQNRVQEYRNKLNSVSQYIEDHPDSEGTTSTDDTPEIVDSLNTILAYAECDEELTTKFKNAVNQYRKLQDKNSTDDSSRKLRLGMTKLFYQVYKQVFFKSVSDYSVPKIILMFFNFGYIDEQLAGMDNAAYLYSIVDKLPSNPDENVYTIYEWLRAVYDGRKAPSRNEFDNDYTAYVHELKVTGKISAGEETTMLNDKKQRATFEIDNMFTSVNKMTFGRISTFSPIFSEHNILKELPTSLVTAAKVKESLDHIRSTDFSAFYRDTIYTNPDLGIGKEYISVEVLPDVILMPNIGIRGVMWQEIEGRKRTTPSRMMVSIFQMEDLNNLIVRMTGEYRWEMCKRIQGARWNDVSDASLTSEYFDYIQFYKKNRDLSADAKDKVKLSMQKAKNSFKEMFIRDYCSWIIYEGAGSPRLNKVARTILFTYCPFAKEIRNKLKANPLYKDMMDRYDIKLGQKIHHMNNLFQKIKNLGADIPEDIQKQRNYLDL